MLQFSGSSYLNQTPNLLISFYFLFKRRIGIK